MSAPLANTPHSAYGIVRYPDGTFPGQLAITAFILSRPQETLHEYSVGCGYDNITGTWYIGCANFSSSWHIGDTLNVTFDDGSGNGAEARLVLTGAPADKAEDTILAKPIVTVTLTTSPPGLVMFVNDSAYTAPAVFSWEAGTQQTIAVDSLIEPRAGSRHRFLNWSDAAPRERLFTVPSSAVEIRAYFSTEHYLEIISDFGKPEGEGWYSEGGTAVISVASPDYLSSGERARFNGWSGSGEGAYSGSDETATVTMDGPVTQLATWIMQYRVSLTVTPPAGGTISVLPAGTWFDTGTGIVLEALPDTALQYTFAAWQGDVPGTDNPLALTVTAPLSVQALFSNNDRYAPVFDFLYPLHGSDGVRRNSQLYFRVTDPVPYSGIDLSCLTVLLNSDTLIYNGQLFAEYVSISLSENRVLSVMIDMDGHLTPGPNGVTVTGADYMVNRFSRVSIFTVANEMISGKTVSLIDGQGGTISIPNALGTRSASLTVPFGVYQMPFHLTTGTCITPPSMPDNAEPAGAVIYTGPAGHVFPDSVVLQLPYTQKIMDEVNAAHPADIPVLFYSYADDTWREIFAYRVTSDYLYTRIGETGIYCFGDRHLTHVTSDPGMPASFDRGSLLGQNYPNPFNQSTRIPFSLAEASDIDIHIYNIQGKMVRRLKIHARATPAGYHEVIWDGLDSSGIPVSSGMYIYALIRNGVRIQTKQLIISR
ncbi:T9SS type A sorting domain-containing protein [bacterium]|nr:T9SS type A sorting domain-containing protein [bacterium]